MNSISDKRQRILSAALDEFAEVGLTNSSLESIADKANLELGSVRALFLDKETLLSDLLKEKTEPMVNAIGLAVEQIRDPKELLRKSLQLYDQWCLENEKAIKIFQRCSLESESILKLNFQQSLLPSEFYERLGQLIDDKQIRCENLFILSIILDSLITFPHQIRSAIELMSPEQKAEQVIEGRFEAMMDLFENGLFTA